jgi:hypothetical protein
VISRYRVANAFQIIGELVDIGGRRVQLDCRGVGTPTVVFESGLDLNGSLSWSAIHDEIAKATRECPTSTYGAFSPAFSKVRCRSSAMRFPFGVPLRKLSTSWAVKDGIASENASYGLNSRHREL